MEYPAFISGHRGKNIYSFLHLPDKPHDRGFVFCAPLFGEKTKSHRVGVSFARLLAARGYPVLRFDYWGDGDSDGDFEEADIQSRVDDIGRAACYLEQAAKVRRVWLWGLRMGAPLAAFAAQRRDEVEALLLWDPVMRVRDYLYDCLRANLSNQLMVHRKVLYNRQQLIDKMQAGETVNIDGWRMPGSLWEQGSAIDLFRELPALNIPVFIAATASGSAGRIMEFPIGGNVHCERLPQECSWQEWKQYDPLPRHLFRQSMRWVSGAGTDPRR